MSKLIGWNRPVRGKTVGWTDDNVQYEIERNNVRGSLYFTVTRNGAHVGDKGSLGLAKDLAEDDARLASRSSGVRAAFPGSPMAGPAFGSRRNPSYKATFTTPAGPREVKRALKGAGYTDLRVRSSEPGKKRKAGPYALFVKSKMPSLMASGMSAGEAMKAVGKLWRERGAKSNPRRNPAKKEAYVAPEYLNKYPPAAHSLIRQLAYVQDRLNGARTTGPARQKLWAQHADLEKRIAAYARVNPRHRRRS